MRPPLVSYVICTYNGARFVAESIASVLNQTHPRIELIVVDDGSTDETPAILREIGDRRLRVVTQPNMGLGFSSNRGAAVAHGEYIGGLGHDDVLLPEKTEVQLRAIRDKGWDFALSWAQVINAQGDPVEHEFLSPLFNRPWLGQREALERLAHGNFLCAPSFLGRRHCVLACPRNVALLCLDDFHRWLHLFRRYRGGVVERQLVRYRVHERNTSFDERFPDRYRQFEDLAARILALLDHDPTHRLASFWSEEKLMASLAQVEWLQASGDAGLALPAYVLANRALDLSPLDPRCYDALARLLGGQGFSYPASLLSQRAAHLKNVVPYPIPLAPSPARRLYRFARLLLETPSRGWWQRLEIRLLNLLNGAPLR